MLQYDSGEIDWRLCSVYNYMNAMLTARLCRCNSTAHVL